MAAPTTVMGLILIISNNNFQNRVEYFNNRDKTWKETKQAGKVEKVTTCIPRKIAQAVGMSACVKYDHINDQHNKNNSPMLSSNFNMYVERVEKFDWYIFSWKLYANGAKIKFNTPGSTIRRSIRVIIAKKKNNFILQPEIFGKKYQFKYKNETTNDAWITSFQYNVGKELKGELRLESKQKDVSEEQSLSFLWFGKKFEIVVNSGGPHRDCQIQECGYGLRVYTDFFKNPTEIDGNKFFK